MTIPIPDLSGKDQAIEKITALAAITHDNDDVSVNAVDDDVYTIAGNEQNFTAIAEDDDDVFVTAELFRILL